MLDEGIGLSGIKFSDIKDIKLGKIGGATPDKVAAYVLKEGNMPAVETAVIAIIAIIVVMIAAALIIRKYNKKKKPDVDGYDDGIKIEGQRSQTGMADGFNDEIIHTEGSPTETGKGSVGKVHHIGRRKSQQDSFGVLEVNGGMFAVVADGMGGLSDGDRVSQIIVLTMLQDAAGLRPGQIEERPLYAMISNANREVIRMLGVTDRCRSGSTVVAVLTEGNRYQWISVGDSRIYLYHANQLMQINNEHIYEKELLQKAVNQEISFAEVNTDRQRKRVTSFIGMGDLKHIEGSLHPTEVHAGDKILLMSDGVFNTLPEQEICRILYETENAEAAAAVLKERILARQNPKQDNFTAVILDI